ncbi:division/cell wall cluster transcriptional repressor MraZ [bacterium]|nr:division/cell wall cluster transcriptional repressor MraZ [bacterium]
MAGFFGQYQTTMDDKGRFALPAKLRHVIGHDGNLLLEGNIILNRGLEGCLAVYAEDEWNSVQERLATLDFTNQDYRYFSRRFYSGVSQVTPDKNGRVLVPQHLIAEADLKKELLILGVNRWIEVWNPDRYNYYLQQYRGTYEEVAGRLFSGKHDQSGE